MTNPCWITNKTPRNVKKKKVQKCKHERQIKFYPKDVTWFNTVSRASGKHNTIIIEGCLDCHKLWVRDYGE